MEVWLVFFPNTVKFGFVSLSNSGTQFLKFFKLQSMNRPTEPVRTLGYIAPLWPPWQPTRASHTSPGPQSLSSTGKSFRSAVCVCLCWHPPCCGQKVSPQQLRVDNTRFLLLLKNKRSTSGGQIDVCGGNESPSAPGPISADH